ncbi:MAG: hypothetical protein NC218_01515 [Acetobacter sp.]|nr:hypothetical protein [Acetobacter sp.]
MTFAEFIEQDLDCSECPIARAEYCGHAIGFDRDPPCSFADPDQDMDDWVREKHEQVRRIEDAEQRRIREAKKLQRAKDYIETCKPAREKLLQRRKQLDEVNRQIEETALTDELLRQKVILEKAVEYAEQDYFAAKKQFFANNKK